MLAALGMAAVSALAQETVINSKPADVTSDKANSFLGDPKRQINAGDYNAPRKLFNDYSPSLPMPRPLILNNQDPSAQDAWKKRKNWMLLTPEQILGVQTPEDILGIKDPNNEKKLSLEEQYLLRQGRSAAFAATNGRTGTLPGNDGDNPFTKKRDDQNPFSSGPFASRDLPTQAGSMKPLNSLFNSKVSDSFGGDERNKESAWTSVFAQPSQPKLTLEQLADRERFRALMEPNSQPATPVRFSETLPPTPDPYLQPQPKFNPAGHSYSSLENNSARPTGINPLPGITGPAPKPVEKRPSWQAQPPPWLSDGPQAHNPNRNF